MSTFKVGVSRAFSGKSRYGKEKHFKEGVGAKGQGDDSMCFGHQWCYGGEELVSLHKRLFEFSEGLRMSIMSFEKEINSLLKKLD